MKSQISLTSRICRDLINKGYDPMDLAGMAPKDLHELHAIEYPQEPIIVISGTANGVSRRVIERKAA